MNPPTRVGDIVVFRSRGVSHRGEVTAVSRSRATVSYVDPYGTPRVVTLALGRIERSDTATA